FQVWRLQPRLFERRLVRASADDGNLFSVEILDSQHWSRTCFCNQLLLHVSNRPRKSKPLCPTRRDCERGGNHVTPTGLQVLEHLRQCLHWNELRLHADFFGDSKHEGLLSRIGITVAL